MRLCSWAATEHCSISALLLHQGSSRRNWPECALVVLNMPLGTSSSTHPARHLLIGTTLRVAALMCLRCMLDSSLSLAHCCIAAPLQYVWYEAVKRMLFPSWVKPHALRCMLD
jgi:hypothetical protein